MNVLRKTVLGIVCGLLPVLLFSFGLSFSLERVFGQPDSLKNALQESGIYDAAAGNFLAIAQQRTSAEAGQNGEVPIDQPEVRPIIERAFPADSLQPKTEKVVDNVYAWVHGDTRQFKFSFDLKPNQDNLLADLTKHVQERAAKLPVCPPGTPIGPASFNAFNADCLPPGVTPELAAQHAAEKIKQSDFFQQSSVSSETLQQEGEAPLDNRFSDLPSLYDRVVKGIYVSGILALLFLPAAVFLSQPWREGLRRVAKILTITGAVSVALAMLSVLLTEKLAGLFAKSAGETPSFQTGLANTAHTLASDVRAWWLAYGILLIVLGIVAYLLLKVLKEKEIIDHNQATPPEARPQVFVS